MKKSLYKTLEVSENASAEDIKKSYRKLARKYHPDINKEKDAEEKFKEINAAYEILSDPNKRAQYDKFGDKMFGGQDFGDFARQQGNVNIEDILASIFGGQGGFNSGFTQGNPFGAFGGFGGFGGFDPTELDLHCKLSISLQTAVLGGKQQVNLENNTFTIKIPAGIREGDKLRAEGKGKSYQNLKGNAIFTIHIQEDPIYTLENDDLIMQCEIPLKTALFGGTIEVKTLHKDIKLKVPQDTKNGQKFRLKELGIKNRKTGKVGDLYLKSHIIMPKLQDLSPELQQKLQEELN